MERETIIYNGKKYHRYPNHKKRNHRVYYKAHTKWLQPPKALHRQLWEDNFGKIPKGWVVHHKDHNPLNNDLPNLEIMPRGKHQSLHCQTEERKEISRKALAKYARPNAILWHGSKEGRKWHKGHYEESLGKAQKNKHICFECHKQYLSTRKVRTKFCSDECGKIYRKKEKGL